MRETNLLRLWLFMVPAFDHGRPDGLDGDTFPLHFWKLFRLAL